jgi:hypothetical protein
VEQKLRSITVHNHNEKSLTLLPYILEIKITSHAIDRAHCGGCLKRESGWPLYMANRHYGDNRVARTLTGRILRRLVKEGEVTHTKAERLEGTTVLTEDREFVRWVVTTLPKRPRLGPQRCWLRHRRYLGNRNLKSKQVRAEAA